MCGPKMQGVLSYAYCTSVPVYWVTCEHIRLHFAHVTCLLPQVAIAKMDEKVRDHVNILNNHKYTTVKKQKKKEELQTQYNQMRKDASEAEATDAGESDEAQVS